MKSWITELGNERLKQSKFTLLDVSRGLHISESTVSISHKFR
jgi:hypothetical protein